MTTKNKSIVISHWQSYLSTG